MPDINIESVERVDPANPQLTEPDKVSAQNQSLFLRILLNKQALLVGIAYYVCFGLMLEWAHMFNFYFHMGVGINTLYELSETIVTLETGFAAICVLGILGYLMFPKLKPAFLASSICSLLISIALAQSQNYPDMQFSYLLSRGGGWMIFLSFLLICTYFVSSIMYFLLGERSTSRRLTIRLLLVFVVSLLFALSFAVVSYF